jgi:potassium uptake TrkH family protein
VLLVGGSSLVMSLVAELPEWTTGRWSPWLLAGWGAGLAGATLGRWSIAGLAAGIATRQGVVLARRHLDRRTVHDALNYLFSRPAQMFALSFALVISAGALVLSFPVCSATGHAMRPVDALFTSVSAVCVTGLATIDVPVALTFTGQLVLLVLIQIGGLGVITLSSFAAILLSHRLGLRHESALGALVDQPRPQELARLVRFIVLSTIAIELLGALALWGGFALHDASRPQLVWVALFHSVSAFCNAGFSLQSDSLVAYQSNAAILVPIGVLVLLGGLGFPVMAACGRFVLRSGGRMAVHVRMVLWMTLVLLAGGALAVLVLEWDNTMAGQSWGTRLLSAGFQSVTLRTAGFNSLPVGSLRSATLFLMMIWMFIGGNSGSTAGGIKVTTVAVLLAQIRALLRGRDVTEVFGRQIPHAIVQRAAAVAVLGAASIGAGQFLLLVTQPLPFDRLLFEVVSAAGTVGLSADVTTQLDVFGKLVVIALMYTGRIGPLMLLLTLREDRTARLQAPMENVPVG